MTTYADVPFEADGPFDEVGFWEKLRSVGSRLGRAATEKLLVAYFVTVDPRTPVWAKAYLAGALAYFGLPVDAVPDLVPVLGFGDDVAVLGMALAAVAVSIRVRHLRRAHQVMKGWGMKPRGDVRGSDDDAAWPD